MPEPRWSMPVDPDVVRLRHMLDAASKAVEFVSGKVRADLDGDEKLVLALLKLIENLGEASKQVSPPKRERHPEIPWNKIARTRDRLIHGYHDINLDIVWDIVTEHLPELAGALEKILGSEEAE